MCAVLLGIIFLTAKTAKGEERQANVNTCQIHGKSTGNPNLSLCGVRVRFS